MLLRTLTRALVWLQKPAHITLFFHGAAAAGRTGGVWGLAVHEDDDANVVADVALALELLVVVGAVGQEGGDVEHDLKLAPGRVHRVRSVGVAADVQAGAVLRTRGWVGGRLGEVGDE